MPSGQANSVQIRLVAGLGNPGPEYAGTRHNIGFVVVDHFATQLGLMWEKSTKWDALLSKHGDLLLAKPTSFMNRSGYPLAAIAQFYKIAPLEILVVLDDFALPLGRVRIRADGGTGGHNGLDSVITQFGTEEIPRLRIGIGAAPAAGSVDYVLGCFFEEERTLVKSTIERSVEAIKCAVDNGVVAAMNTFNKVEES
jgi:PTH1 family peptidyl-tRNA hydrolase